MSIDWFTVIAQILNFLVLVWLLKRFLYRPVLDAVERRQERIRKSITDAAEQAKRAEDERRQLDSERKELEASREKVIQTVREETDAERHRLLHEAREEYEANRLRWQKALESEREEFQRELSKQAHSEVIGIADKLLRDLADEELQERIVEKFLKQLTELTDERKAALLAERGTDHVLAPVVRSAFPLTEKRKAALKEAASKLLDETIVPEFETKPTLGCGIELSIDGHKIAWTVEDYLRSLDTWVNSLVTEQRRRNTGWNRKDS